MRSFRCGHLQWRGARTRQRGVAFALVLWVIAAGPSCSAASPLIASHRENPQARHLFDSVRARYAAEGPQPRGLPELRNPDPSRVGPVMVGPDEFEFEAPASASPGPTSGKVDINVADATILRPVHRQEARAEALADAISSTGAIPMT